MPLPTSHPTPPMSIIPMCCTPLGLCTDSVLHLKALSPSARHTLTRVMTTHQGLFSVFYMS